MGHVSQHHSQLSIKWKQFKYLWSFTANLYLKHLFLVLVIRMGKEPGKPRGKMSSYAYFVQTCREEHKKKHPDASVNFAEFSKKCSERWKVGDDGWVMMILKTCDLFLKFLFLSRECSICHYLLMDTYNSSTGCCWIVLLDCCHCAHISKD